MLTLPTLSGAELVALLGRSGYKIGSRKGGLATLHRGPNVVIVPDSPSLSATLVRAILRTAEVDPVGLLSDADATVLARTA